MEVIQVANSSWCRAKSIETKPKMKQVNVILAMKNPDFV